MGARMMRPLRCGCASVYRGGSILRGRTFIPALSKSSKAASFGELSDRISVLRSQRRINCRLLPRAGLCARPEDDGKRHHSLGGVDGDSSDICRA